MANCDADTMTDDEGRTDTARWNGRRAGKSWNSRPRSSELCATRSRSSVPLRSCTGSVKGIREATGGATFLNKGGLSLIQEAIGTEPERRENLCAVFYG